jgi:SAM-dependent methyltransferase
MTPPVEPRGCSAGRLPVVNTKSWMGVAWQRQRLHRIRDATVMGDDGRGDGTCPLRRRGGLVRRACRLVNSSRGTADRTARGRGSGWCLDVGCGTGIHLSALAETGWSVVGVDASADQLRVARRRAGPVGAGLIRADAARLPFRAGSCPLVVSAFTHTDVDDFTNLAREARRVLEADGRFIYVGLHPCFTGPFAEQPRTDGARMVHPGICAARLADRRPRVGWRRPDQSGRVPAPSHCPCPQRRAGS